MYNQKMVQLGEERSVIREISEYGNARKKEIGVENVFDFSIGNPSVPAPACVRDEIARLIAEMPPEELHGYSPAPGLFSARKAVAEYIKRAFGVPMSEDLVYITCGASASLVIALSALLRVGEEVVVPAPFFPEYAVFVNSAGGKLVPVPTDERFHLDLNAIERAIGKNTRAVLVNSPNNPTGAIYAEGEMRALGELLRTKSRQYGAPIFLVADEPYRELTYGDPPVFPMAVYEDTLVLYSFSKSLSLAGERIGYVAVSPQCENAETLYAAVCGAARAHGYVCAPTLFQRVVSACLGKVSDVGAYKANRDLLYGALSDMGYACTVPEGAFYLFIEALEPDANAFCEHAKKYELLLVPSDSFGVPGYVRISYCVARETIERSLPAFQKLIADYRD